MKNVSESELLNFAQSGDERAFRELFRRHGEFVARIVVRVMGPSSELEDIVQDVFVQVFRSIRSFRGDSKFTTWLYRVTSNVTRMHLRKKRSRLQFVEAPDADFQERKPDELQKPGENLAHRQQLEALYRLVHRLSDKKRDVLLMHDFGGLAAKEIALELEIPVMTVRTRLFYARKELMASLHLEPALAEMGSGGTLVPLKAASSDGGN